MNKRILIVVNGIENFFTHRLPLVRELKKQGYDVFLLAPSNKIDPRLKSLEDDIKIVTLKFNRKSINPFSAAMSIAKCYKVFLKIKPDIIFNVAMKTSLYSSVTCIFYRKALNINLMTGLGYLFISPKKRIKLIQFFVKKCFKLSLTLSNSRMIFQNKDDMHLFLQESIVLKDRAFLVRGSGVDLNRYMPVPEPDDIHVLFSGRLLKDKGIQEFVEAAKILMTEGVKAKFILVGDVDPGNPSTVKKETVLEWVKKGYVEWWGYYEDMASILPQINIVCLPSYREGLPKILLEGAACQRALVTTNVPGCREVVEDGVNGLLVEVKSSISLAKALCTLITDHQKRAEMASKARNLVERDFSDLAIAKQTVDVFNHRD